MLKRKALPYSSQKLGANADQKNSLDKKDRYTIIHSPVLCVKEDAMAENVQVLTTGNFQKEVLEYAGLVIVDFWAPWCGPCMRMSQTLEMVASEIVGSPDVKIGKVNVDDNRDLAGQYHIMSIPTILFIKNGKLVNAIVGACSSDKITELIQRYQ